MKRSEEDIIVNSTDMQAKLRYRTAAFVSALLLSFVLLTTATQALCFWIPGWWRAEYSKYNTPANVNGEMSLDDAVHVTEDMLEYCIGRLDTLDNTEAVIDGVSAPFFTEREKSHLADCRELFLAAVRARAISLLLIIAFIIFIYVHNGRAASARLLARGYLMALAALVIFAAAVAVMSLIDFTFVFTVFHRIFFDNNLWILYPDKDNLINIMQEDVFADAAMWIGSMWLAASAIIAAISASILRKPGSASDGSRQVAP